MRAGLGGTRRRGSGSEAPPHGRACQPARELPAGSWALSSCEAGPSLWAGSGSAASLLGGAAPLLGGEGWGSPQSQ